MKLLFPCLFSQSGEWQLLWALHTLTPCQLHQPLSIQTTKVPLDFTVMQCFPLSQYAFSRSLVASTLTEILLISMGINAFSFWPGRGTWSFFAPCIMKPSDPSKMTNKKAKVWDSPGEEYCISHCVSVKLQSGEVWRMSKGTWSQHWGQVSESTVSVSWTNWPAARALPRRILWMM